jgi:hypothetical protein
MSNKAWIAMALKVVVRMALGVSLAAMLPLEVTQAASGDGSLVGRLTSSDGGVLQDAEVTVRNPETGFSRTVKADADGSYRFPFLPVGKYTVEVSKSGATVGKLPEVTIGLGTATTANVSLNLANIENVEVTGTRIVTAIDVKSTESATNVTREELERLPVERDLLSVAMLAPGLSKGDAGMCTGGNCGVSFGGSSVAENTVYINGLNVTDFYNRVGSSTVPYAFYKEFQVKTGGYSVEFGRTTGGVINAVTRSGTNEFEFGTEVAWEPSFLQTSKTDRFRVNGTPYIIGSYDEYDRTNASVYASGPIVRDKLFFFALYETRDFDKKNTSNSANTLFKETADDGFWGAKIDWQIAQRHRVELLAFSDENESVTDSFDFGYPQGTLLGFDNREFETTGGTNWAATYTAYLTNTLSMKVLYGENEREFARNSSNDLTCSRIRDRQEDIGQGDVGCTRTPSVTERVDEREAVRLDFEWELDAHLLRFGLDHEVNTSNHQQYYPGPDRLLYEVYTNDDPRLPNDFPWPANTPYVQTRRNEVDGEFESVNRAYYVEDNWSVTPNLVLNGGVRLEAFDNKNSDGDSYIKIDDMVAPRFGFSWDLKGDSRSKVFGNAGRYFLPVANVINIKQAGGFRDERTYYRFDGFQTVTENGRTFQRPRLGPQLGPVDNSQGDGTVGDLRGEVDRDIDPVYQDELILGFQSMLDGKWSWGVRGIYRKLHNAIDDMEITSTGVVCAGAPVGAGFVMGNPGRPLTLYTDTNCDGANDGFVTIDTSRAGWALYDADDNYVGEVGYPEPKRSYKALEFMIDRAWDGAWAFNAAYTLSYSKGNAEGPVNSDTDFADAGRTEAFDNPWVNYGADGYLPNDHRHQLKLRGSYALTQNWEVGATANVQSGRPVSAIGATNPFDDTSFYSFFISNQATGQYELHPRGSEGRTPWTYDVGANVTYRYSFSAADLQVKLSVYNLFNQERIIEVDESLGSIPNGNSEYRMGTAYQSPRYALLTVKLDF